MNQNETGTKYRINFCKYCGCAVEQDMLFCPDCGKTLGKPTPVAPVKRSFSGKWMAFLLCAVLIVMTIALLPEREPKKTVFQKAFEEAGGKKFCGEWVTVFEDGSGMKIDTNPGDIDDFYDPDAMDTIEKIHAALGLPDSLLEKMRSTRALDGRQSKTSKGIEVSWTYHPDHGLEILYELEED